MAEARAPALAEIQRLLDSVGADLDKVAAAEDLRQVATGKLKGLLEQVKKEGSIAHIAQAQEAAGAGYDFALTAIEKAQAPNLPASSTTPGKPAPSSPTVATLKKRRVVDAKALWSGGFIETADDMEEFLKKLRAELEEALEAEERIQIK